MKTQDLYLSLAAELTNSNLSTARSPENIINHVSEILNKFSQVLGHLLGIEELNKRKIGKLFANKTYVFNFGSHRLAFNLLFFQPAQRWELKNFQLIQA